MLKFAFVLVVVIATAISNHIDSDMSESKEMFINELLENMKAIQYDNYHSNTEDYLKFFGSLEKEDTEPFDLGKIYKPKQKRFIKGIFDKLFGKSEETSEKPTSIISRTTTRFTKVYSPAERITSKESEDVFYKLKAHCDRTYDTLCISKKKELYDLVKKCDAITNGYKQKSDACDDVISIYCYVFYQFSTCYDRKYKPYQPGQKTSSYSTTRSSSTRAPIQIPVIVVTSSKYSTPTTFKTSTRTTTRTTTKTTASTFRPSTKNSNSPFDGPVNSVPTDAGKLKKIGEYCLSNRDINCDKMLALLKEKFKKCEQQPKTDRDCQSFKIEFCTAFKNFPCCPDVLAGRQCNGKTNSRSFLTF